MSIHKVHSREFSDICTACFGSFKLAKMASPIGQSLRLMTKRMSSHRVHARGAPKIESKSACHVSLTSNTMPASSIVLGGFDTDISSVYPKEVFHLETQRHTGTGRGMPLTSDLRWEIRAMPLQSSSIPQSEKSSQQMTKRTKPSYSELVRDTTGQKEAGRLS